MAKGTIISHDGDALYTIELDHAQAKYEAEKARLEDLIATNNDEVSSAYTTLVAAKFSLVLARQEEIEGINTYNLNKTDENKAAIEATTDLVITATAEVKAAQEKYDNLKLTSTSLNLKLLSTLQDVYATEPEQLQAWCADYNTELTGDVGLIDVAYDGRITPIIRPAGEDGDNAAYNASTDGKFAPIEILTADSAYNSYALQPGYIKHKPRYRKGVIDSIDEGADTAVVTLDALTFDHDDGPIDLNQTTTVNADVVYMSCASTAFEVGDRVVVAFSGDWDTPQVIGFESNPRVCEPNISFYWAYDSTGGSGYTPNARITKINGRTGDVKATVNGPSLYSSGLTEAIGGEYNNGTHYSLGVWTFFGGSAPKALSIYKNFGEIYSLGEGGTDPRGHCSRSIGVNSSVIVGFLAWQTNSSSDEQAAFVKLDHDGNIISSTPIAGISYPTAVKRYAYLSANETHMAYTVSEGDIVSGPMTRYFVIADLDNNDEIKVTDPLGESIHSIDVSSKYCAFTGDFLVSALETTKPVYFYSMETFTSLPTVNVTRPTDPDPPSAFTGYDPTLYYMTCITDDRLTVLWRYRWARTLTTPDQLFSRTKIIIQHYDYDGSTATLSSTLPEVELLSDEFTSYLYQVKNIL